MARRLRAPVPTPTPKPAPVKVDWESGGKDADVYASLEGMSALIANIEAMPENAQHAAGYEMADIAEEVIADAKENYVPKLTWRLHDSGGSDEYNPKANMGFAEIRMWFGAPPDGVSSGQETIAGSAAIAMGLNLVVDPSEYAYVQHENMEWTHPNGGGPKYLERPFIAKLPTVVPRLAAAVGRALGFEGGMSMSQIVDVVAPLSVGRQMSSDMTGIGSMEPTYEGMG